MTTDFKENEERDQSEIEELLDDTVWEIIGEELEDRYALYDARGGPEFGLPGKESFYDFIRVEEDTGNSRLILVLFNCDNSNWWYPEGLFQNQAMYPIGTDKRIVYEKFSAELKAGIVPSVTFVQTGERSKEEDDRWWDCFQTVCFKVKNQEYILKVEELVGNLDTKEILVRKPQEVVRILERIENDSNLVSKSDFTFDYIGIRNYNGGSGEDSRKFIREKYWGGKSGNES